MEGCQKRKVTVGWLFVNPVHSRASLVLFARDHSIIVSPRVAPSLPTTITLAPPSREMEGTHKLSYLSFYSGPVSYINHISTSA